MPRVTLLVEGYALKDPQKASSAVTLIQDNNINIIADPGIDRTVLLESLAKINLKPADINYVILTHNHIDHCALMGIFENAQIIDDSDISSFDGLFHEHNGKIAGTHIKIISTPGHDQFHCSIIVEDDNLGRIAIAGDVFWWWNSEEQKTDYESLIFHVDEYVKNADQITQSRKLLLESADYIIPGHGKMFKVEGKS